MLNKTIIFTLIFIGLFLIPFSFAQDNSTEVLSDDSSYSDIGTVLFHTEKQCLK